MKCHGVRCLPSLPHVGEFAQFDHVNRKSHPRSEYRSTAIALLKAGVDFATISQWLGHAGLNTTMRYARADLDLKRQALSQVFPDALAPPRAGRLLLDGSDMVGWLRRL